MPHRSAEPVARQILASGKSALIIVSKGKESKLRWLPIEFCRFYAFCFGRSQACRAHAMKSWKTIRLVLNVTATGASCAQTEILIFGLSHRPQHQNCSFDILRRSLCHCHG